jgi:hypothetical protein
LSSQHRPDPPSPVTECADGIKRAIGDPKVKAMTGHEVIERMEADGSRGIARTSRIDR